MCLLTTQFLQKTKNKKQTKQTVLALQMISLVKLTGSCDSSAGKDAWH